MSVFCEPFPGTPRSRGLLGGRREWVGGTRPGREAEPREPPNLLCARRRLCGPPAASVAPPSALQHLRAGSPEPRQPQGPALRRLAPNFASVLGPNAEGVGAETPALSELGVHTLELLLVGSDSPWALPSARQTKRGGGAGNKTKINRGGTTRSKAQPQLCQHSQES